MNSTLKPIFDRSLLVLGGALIAATLALLVFTGGQKEQASTPAGAAPAAVDRVVIEDFLFAPAEITVPVGTKITWRNVDSAPHTATSGTSPNPDTVFDTGTIKGGQSGSVIVQKPGTFAYFCEFHPYMKGTVTVE
jgi:plastocyanin